MASISQGEMKVLGTFRVHLDLLVPHVFLDVYAINIIIIILSLWQAKLESLQERDEFGPQEPDRAECD